MSNEAEHAGIARVVGTYVEGMCAADEQKLRSSMHEKMCCIGHFDGGLEWDDRGAFIAAVVDAVSEPDPAPWWRIGSISVTGDMAVVEVENIWLGMHFDDILTLLFHEGRWLIVSKVFHQRAAGS